MMFYGLCMFVLLLGVITMMSSSSSSEAFPFFCSQAPFHSSPSFLSLDRDGHRLSPALFRVSTSSLFVSNQDSLVKRSNNNNNNNNTITTAKDSSTATSSSSSIQQSPPCAAAVLDLHEQAAALRAEANAMRQELQDQQTQKLQREQQVIDQWIEWLLFSPCSSSCSSNNGGTTATTTTEMLNTVDQVVGRLQQGRFSHEQVRKIFHRLCETETAPQSRSRCSELMRLLVEAAGAMDCLERDQNPNKRWSGWVERDLQKRLFAKDWGIELEDNDSLEDSRML